MKKLLVFVVVFAIAPTAAAQVSLSIYQFDGNNLSDFNDVMVGSQLEFILSSDSNETWSGGLFTSGPDRSQATISGRGTFDPNLRDWSDSHYEAAGNSAKATAWQDSSIWGFDFYTAVLNPEPNSHLGNPTAGDWFVVDYTAEQIGDCNVGFYDYSISWSDPNYSIALYQTPTRDLNSDNTVNFSDFSTFASQWLDADCNDPNWCDGGDLDRDANVDKYDLRLFTTYWLWPTGPDPNAPVGPLLDDTIIYSIVDANESNEITIDVNESITLYVDLTTTDTNDIWLFDVEAQISNTNLGSIDNTAHPNGTASILASPRFSIFDAWGPGTEQAEGIRLGGATFGQAISDGHLASFEFTCNGEGDVILSLKNWYSELTDYTKIIPKMESILIHQSGSQQAMGGGGEGGMAPQPMSMTETTPQARIDELVNWLEQLWETEEEIREIFTEAEWQEFIDSIKASGL